MRRRPAEVRRGAPGLPFRFTVFDDRSPGEVIVLGILPPIDDEVDHVTLLTSMPVTSVSAERPSTTHDASSPCRLLTIRAATPSPARGVRCACRIVPSIVICPSIGLVQRRITASRRVLPGSPPSRRQASLAAGRIGQHRRALPCISCEVPEMLERRDLSGHLVDLASSVRPDGRLRRHVRGCAGAAPDESQPCAEFILSGAAPKTRPIQLGDPLRLARGSETRLARFLLCSATNALFRRKSACCGTVVVNRIGAC